MVADTVAYLAEIRDTPAWAPMPDSVKQALTQPLPRLGVGAERAYAEFVEHVLPYTNGNRHPRFFGWVQGNGTVLGMMADMLAAAMNPHLAGFNHAPALVEHQVIAWLAELFDMPGASGVLVTGGTMASTLGLTVARTAAQRAAGDDTRHYDTRHYGVQAWPDREPPRPLVFYGSTETHGWAGKAAELLGLGNRAFRKIAVDAEYRIRLADLREQITADRRAGLQPFCVVGTAGTVNTGATDDLDALADLCHAERLWFHVDGAFGALAYLSPKLRPALRGLSRADSLGFDLHKWGSLPFECACLLVRDPDAHHAAFAYDTSHAAYLAKLTRGVTAGGFPFADRGIELTRGFKALKVWMSLKADGVDKLARLIEQNVEQTRYLKQRVEQTPELELLASAPLNIVCFRYRRPGASEEALNALNSEILLRLQEQGIAVPSSTVLDGRFAIRVANVNHRTRREDIDAIVDGVLKVAASA
jgi:aromatic-L-amino-acid/L-tryptophan decarboxylase